MIQHNEPRISVPPQAFLDAAVRNAREERSAFLHQLVEALTRSVSVLWDRQAHGSGKSVTAGCS